MILRAKSAPRQCRMTLVYRLHHRLWERIEPLLEMLARTPDDNRELQLLQIQHAHNPPFVQPRTYRVRRPRRR